MGSWTDQLRKAVRGRSSAAAASLLVLVLIPSLAHGAGQAGSFDCPEEFGYYAHPGDCTQYYVCVFGGALLESCTGGLMYSHELQTCDWPRNVGCDVARTEGPAAVTSSATAASSTNRASSRRQRPEVSGRIAPAKVAVQYEQNSDPITIPRQRQSYERLTETQHQRLYEERIPQQQQQQQQQQEPRRTRVQYHEVASLSPHADEDEDAEGERQQRVLRGQPATVGQVQRDRDGLVVTRAHTNAIPTGVGHSEKISSISFGVQDQSSRYGNQKTHIDLTNELTPGVLRRKRQVDLSWGTASPSRRTRPHVSSQLSLSHLFDRPSQQSQNYQYFNFDVGNGKHVKSSAAAPHQYSTERVLENFSYFSLGSTATSRPDVQRFGQYRVESGRFQLLNPVVYTNRTSATLVLSPPYEHAPKGLPRFPLPSESDEAEEKIADFKHYNYHAALSDAPSDVKKLSKTGDRPYRPLTLYGKPYFDGLNKGFAEPSREIDADQINYKVQLYPIAPSRHPSSSVGKAPAVHEPVRLKLPKYSQPYILVQDNKPKQPVGVFTNTTADNLANVENTLKPPSKFSKKPDLRTPAQFEVKGGKLTKHKTTNVKTKYSHLDDYYYDDEVVLKPVVTTSSTTSTNRPLISQHSGGWTAIPNVGHRLVPTVIKEGTPSIHTTGTSAPATTESIKHTIRQKATRPTVIRLQTPRRTTPAITLGPTVKTPTPTSSKTTNSGPDTFDSKTRISDRQPNATVQEQNPPHDAYYAIYDETAELYRDSDYSNQPTYQQGYQTYSAQPETYRTATASVDYDYNTQDEHAYKDSGRQSNRGNRNELKFVAEMTPKRKNNPTSPTTVSTSHQVSVKKQNYILSRSDSGTSVISSTIAPMLRARPEIRPSPPRPLPDPAPSTFDDSLERLYLDRRPDSDSIESKKSNLLQADEIATRIPPKIVPTTYSPPKMFLESILPKYSVTSKTISALPYATGPSGEDHPLSKTVRKGSKNFNSVTNIRTLVTQTTPPITTYRNILDSTTEGKSTLVSKVHFGAGRAVSALLGSILGVNPFRDEPKLGGNSFAELVSEPSPFKLADPEKFAYRHQPAKQQPTRITLKQQAQVEFKPGVGFKFELIPDPTQPSRSRAEESTVRGSALYSNDNANAHSNTNGLGRGQLFGDNTTPRVTLTSYERVPLERAPIERVPIERAPIERAPIAPVTPSQSTDSDTDISPKITVPTRASAKNVLANGAARIAPNCNVQNTKCNEIKQRPTITKNRGSIQQNVAAIEPVTHINRGTPAPRSRPTLKPSTSIVSKASEFIDIYKFPPRRPEAVYPTPQPDKTAAKCRKDVCLLPDCYCGGKEVPGDLPVQQVPQIVLLTFDDSVNDLNKGLYSDLFERGRTNPNGCPISATFYVSHEWTDYSQVQNLYSDGHELASHTVSHSFGEQFSQKKWYKEVAGQREILSAYGGVRLEDVRGMRAPFLSVGGNKMFKMLYDANFTYDSSMPVYENRPPSWPYTLDYRLFHDCMIPPCPTRSYPGVWEVPMVMWQDLNGGRCSMGDACSNPPTSDGVAKMLFKNFERHYTTNRSPFGLFYHAAWFTQPHHKEGFIRFLDTILAMPDVYLVTNWQAIQWVRDPTPLSRIGSFQPFRCDYSDRPKRCNNPKVCNLWHKSGVRYMRTCQPCPDIYPWTGKTGIRSSRIDNDIED